MSTHRVPSPAGERLGSLERWHLRSVLLALVALVVGGCATDHPRGSLPSGFGIHSRSSSFRYASEPTPLAAPPSLTEAVGDAAGAPVRKADAGKVARPPGWPDLPSSDAEELLAPFLACASLEQFMELQRGVDMPRLVEALDDWRAVRLGTLGPLGENAAEVLDRKRAAFLVQATREYGVARAELFALFILHSAFTDDLRRVLLLLAGDKQLGETLAKMSSVREELARRGLNLSDYQDRPERLGDVVRGLASAANEALSTSELRRGVLAIQYSERRGQLPPPYQQALDEVERAEQERRFSPGNVALGSFDTLTFGVPLGFYYLTAGTSHGVYSLSLGQYEQATRELAPAALLVALFPFDAEGYPDFRAAGVVKAEVKITYTGSRARDFATANKAAGLGETPKGMTWHHHQDGTTLQLVPTETHARTGHTGGFSGGQ